MSHYLIFALGVFLGTFFGIFVIALCKAGGDADIVIKH